MSNKLSIKSKLGAEFRRFSLKKTLKFDEFKTELERFHNLFEIPFFIYYTDPLHGDLLPINNDDNFSLAISLNINCLKLHLQTKGESWIQNNGSGKKKNFFENINHLLPLTSSTYDKGRKLHISLPEDFRQVSSIIDVDVVPETCRRVRLVKHGSEKPLGFYIRDGTSVRVTATGLQKVPGIFISRLVPGGLAESTGLLAVNDEVLEVNGIEVLGKTLDQVTDMMVANSSNLIITIRPANQRIPFNYPSLPLQHQTQKNSDQNNQNSHKLTGNNHLGKNHDTLSSNGSTSIKNSNKRIPHHANENTLTFPSTTHKKLTPSTQQSTSNYTYFDNKNNGKVPIKSSLSNNYLVNLAEGEDSDEEDEIKDHLDGQNNLINKEQQTNKNVKDEDRSYH